MQGYLWKPVTGSSNRGDQKYQNCNPGSFRYGKAFDAVSPTEAKRERNVLDFNDLEHLTLQVLTVEEEDGTRVPSQAAGELS